MDLDILNEAMSVYSSSEISMIRFALQLFSSSLDDITIPEVMRSLDNENEIVIVQAILFRYTIEI